MVKKIHKCFFGFTLGLSTLALIGSLSSLALSAPSNGSKLTLLQRNTNSKSLKTNTINEMPVSDAFNIQADPVEKDKWCIWTTKSGIPYANVPEHIYAIDYYGISSNVFQIVTLPQSLEVIRAYSIENCGGLLTITIPENVINIGEARGGYDDPVFKSDDSLKKIIVLCKSNDVSVKNNAFASLPDDLKCYVVNDQVRAKIIENGIPQERTVKASINSEYFVCADDENRTLVGLTNPGRTQNTLTIPENVRKIDDYAFTEHKNQTLNTIRLLNDHIEFSEKSFWGLSQDVNYEVSSKKLVDNLIEKCHISPNRITFSDNDFVIRNSQIIGLTENGRSASVLKVDPYVTAIAQNAFQDRTSPVSEIDFAKGSQLDPNNSDFTNANLNDTKFCFNASDFNIASALNKKLVDKSEQIILTNQDADSKTKLDPAFRATMAGTLVSVGTEHQEITINNTINKVEINNIASGAFSDCKKLTKINFEAGSKITKVDSGAFSDSQKTTMNFSLNEKDHDLYNALTNAGIERQHITTNVGPNFSLSGGFISEVQSAAVKDHSVFIPQSYQGTKITGITANAFKKCPDVNKITFDEGINDQFDIDKDAFSGLSLANVQYHVYAANEKNLVDSLVKANVDKKQIIISATDFDITADGLIVNVKKSAWDGTVNIPASIDADGVKNELPVKGIGNYAFKELKRVNKIVFPNTEQTTQSFEIESDAFAGLSKDTTYYYVDENDVKVIEQLTNVKIDDDHIIFNRADSQNFEFSRSHLIHLVKEKAFHQEKNVTIPLRDGSSPVSGIDAHAFKEFEGLGTLSSITFDPNNKLTKISLEAFSGLNLANIKFYVNGSSTNIVSNLEKTLEYEGGSASQIIVRDKNFQISATQQLLKFTSEERHLVIAPNYGGINVSGIGQGAFADTNLESIEFSSGVRLAANNMSSDAFSNLVNKPIIYVYSTDNVSAFLKVSNYAEIGVGSDTGDFFTDFSNSARLNGLTFLGRAQKELTIPETVHVIGSNAFSSCSPSLNKITIKGNSLKIAPNAFNTGAIKSILNNIKFFVFSKEVKNELRSQGIKENNIHLELPKKSGVSVTTIGIVTASIILAILLLGLGIGIPMRKQHKISILQMKLNGKRIDKLSVANAMAFKKVVEATGAIKKEVHLLSSDMKALKAASSQPTKKAGVKPPATKPSVNSIKTTSAKPAAAQPNTKTTS